MKRDMKLVGGYQPKPVGPRGGPWGEPPHQGTSGKQGSNFGHGMAEVAQGAKWTAKVPVPPTANNLHANVPRTGRIKTKVYKLWRQAAGAAISIQSSPRPTPPPGTRYNVLICAAIDYRRDLDNVAKPILDLLVSMGVIHDDRYVDFLTMERDTSTVEPGWVRVSVDMWQAAGVQ